MMDNQSTECSELHDGDHGDQDPSSSQNADDKSQTDPSYVTETLATDQPHTTEDQDETVDVKTNINLLCQVGEAAKPFERLDMSQLRSPSSRLPDPLVQFANSSIVSGSENRNTHRKTGADMRILATYMRSLNEMRLPETIPPTELDKYLSSFFLVVRKTDGSEYEPCSLRAMLASIERYLRQKNYPASLTRDIEFSNMRNVLKLKQQMLRSLGKGQKTVAEVSQTACVREGKITRLFQSHEMGPYNPNSIIFSLCFFFCMYLKLRKSTEHKKLLWGDIILCQDYNNREYLTFSPQMLSRIHASQRLNHRLANARVWAEPDVPERDPVALYKFYAQKRPLTMNQPYAPFYLGLNVVNPQAGQSWYRPAAMGINKLNEMVRQIRDLTGLKSSNDTSPLQYLAHTASQDMLPIVSEFSNASSDPSSSRDGHNLDNSDIDYKEVTPSGSPQLTIDVDEACSEPINASTSSEHPLALSLVRESDSSDEQSVKSPSAGRQEEKAAISPALSAVAGAADARGDVFQHHVGTMNAARAREILAQSAEDPDDEEEGEDFIGVEQAKELVTDIIQRMDIMDMAHFDRWLKTMTIARDSFSGQIICKDPKAGSNNMNRNSAFHDLGDRNENTNNESTNILLNIALTPSALRGKGPVTVQATTVRASDLDSLSPFHSSQQTGVSSTLGGSEYSHWNGSKAGNDSPLNLALSSARGSSASESHLSSRVSSSNGTHHKHSASSSLAGAAGDCSLAKQQKLTTSDSAYHLPPYSKATSNYSGTSVVSGVKRSPGQYEGSRRKLNPAFLTHIKPRTSDGDSGKRTVVPLASELETVVNLTHSNPADDEDLTHVLNLKQEVE